MMEIELKRHYGLVNDTIYIFIYYYEYYYYYYYTNVGIYAIVILY